MASAQKTFEKTAAISAGAMGMNYLNSYLKKQLKNLEKGDLEIAVYRPEEENIVNTGIEEVTKKPYIIDFILLILMFAYRIKIGVPREFVNLADGLIVGGMIQGIDDVIKVHFIE